MTTELLGLCSPGVRNQKRPVVCDQLLLELHRTVRIDVLGIVSNDGLGNGLADGINLGGVSTTLYADADVNRSESILSCDENGLIDLEAEDLWLQKADGGTVNVDKAATLLGVGDRSSGLM